MIIIMLDIFCVMIDDVTPKTNKTNGYTSNAQFVFFFQIFKMFCLNVRLKEIYSTHVYKNKIKQKENHNLFFFYVLLSKHTLI